jgi:hypothetical protein
MTFDPYKLIKYHLYLLQLENYELGRFWKLLFRRGWFPPKEQRKNLVWTNKARLLFVAGIFFHILISFLGLWFLSAGLSVFSIQYLVSSILIFVILYTLYPILYTIAVCLLWPVDFSVKQVLIARAKVKIKNLPNLKVVGIAGSYGKTTMKDVLSRVLSSKYSRQCEYTRRDCQVDFKICKR